MCMCIYIYTSPNTLTLWKRTFRLKFFNPHLPLSSGKTGTKDIKIIYPFQNNFGFLYFLLMETCPLEAALA